VGVQSGDFEGGWPTEWPNMREKLGEMIYRKYGHDRDTEWEKYAKCADSNSSWWDSDSEHTAVARAICAKCPVRLQCLEDAKHPLYVEDGEPVYMHGVVRGGVVLRERP